jgi:predicted ATPase
MQRITARSACARARRCELARDTAQAPRELDARLEALGGQRLAEMYEDDFGLFKEVSLPIFFFRP